MYFNNAGWFLTKLYPTLIWKKKVEEKIIYLTFDDGPIPGITEYVLEELERFKVKASFFCVGDNIRKHPEVFKQIISKGHVIGNHTFNHLNGWKTSDDIYLENIRQCEAIMQSVWGNLNAGQTKLFRPPYGLIKKSQIKKLPEYQIVMWDVLTGDFNKELSEEKCLHKAIRYSDKGSIVIFHDSIKAEKNLKYALPRYLDHFCSKGFSFDTL